MLITLIRKCMFFLFFDHRQQHANTTRNTTKKTPKHDSCWEKSTTVFVHCNPALTGDDCFFVGGGRRSGCSWRKSFLQTPIKTTLVRFFSKACSLHPLSRRSGRSGTFNYFDSYVCGNQWLAEFLALKESMVQISMQMFSRRSMHQPSGCRTT